jgi:diguanylate cyclase (GGDEF)-like protein
VVYAALGAASLIEARGLALPWADAVAAQIAAVRDPEAPLGPAGVRPLSLDLAVADRSPMLTIAVPMGFGAADANTMVLVTQAFLENHMLAGIGDVQTLEDARFALTPSGGDRADIPLTNAAGETIGYVSFVPFTPGADVLRSIGPTLTIALLIVIAVTAGLFLRWRSASGRAMASEARAQHLAFHDVLTGLPNRALFDDRLEQGLARMRSGGRQMALLYLDLDRFKAINDTLGHMAGDALMREVADRLRAEVKETDTIARLGGDEFAILYTDVETAAEIALLCSRIGEAIGRPFVLNGSEAFVGVSVGVARARDARISREELVRRADIALHRAKAEGRNTYRVFEPEMDRSIQERRRIERALRHALKEGGELEVHYQPLFASSDRHVVGVEALLRWHSPELGDVPPSRFIPVAEESGLIHELGDFVLRTACKAATDWPIETLAVNVSAAQLRVAAFADRVLAIIEESGLQAQRLELEITESVLVEHAGAALRQLRAAGVRIALDDFGTGYSSLSYLGKYAVDKIKIDKSFVDSVAGHQEAQAIVVAMVELARAMDIRVTAEGVETDEQCTFLTSIGCDQLQGFLFARALPADQLHRLLFKETADRLAAANEAPPTRATGT